MLTITVVAFCASSAEPMDLHTLSLRAFFLCLQSLCHMSVVCLVTRHSLSDPCEHPRRRRLYITDGLFQQSLCVSLPLFNSTISLPLTSSISLSLRHRDCHHLPKLVSRSLRLVFLGNCPFADRSGIRSASTSLHFTLSLFLSLSLSLSFSVCVCVVSLEV